MRTYDSKVENSLWHCSKEFCDGCNYISAGHDCMKQLLKDVYQEHLSDERMIERQRTKIVEQQAEIEKKNTEIDILIRKKGTLRDEISELRAEIERFKNEQARLHIIISKMLKEAKTEAIKEFAERLKATDTADLVGEQYINGEIYGYFYSNAFEIKIDNLVKEMTEQKEEIKK